ncbi:hypothetical protein CDN99_07330 [Roseateles aquatilis]|uniref:DUF692 domain-containing protein n=2 Tax=Roseateles aquatilis TaxID=431061 RepID=A0A246JI37_9BURK|nr:hypothetical protein CDN99_07330 [Roseateles aquatilis]
MERGAPGVDFLEVHTENFVAPGGASRQMLLDAARRHPVSLHGVGLGLGSAVGIDWSHLKRVRELVDAVRPALVSEHACFSRVQRHHEAMHAHELLPIPFSADSLALLASQVDTVQQALGRQILIENLSAYVAWDEDAISEPDFFNALAAKTGCGLLLDLNNLLVNALNRGRDAEAAVLDCHAWLDRIDAGAVGQYHLAGHARLGDLVIDDHGSQVGEEAWAIYRHALGRIGARPTLVEWDNNIPSLQKLSSEVARARAEQGTLDRALIAPPPLRLSARNESAGRSGRVGHAVATMQEADDAAE